MRGYATYLVKATHPEAGPNRRAKAGLAVSVSVRENMLARLEYRATRCGLGHATGKTAEEAIKLLMAQNCYEPFEITLVPSHDD